MNLLANTVKYNRKRVIGWVILALGCIFMIFLGVRMFMDRKYNLVSVLIAILACVPFYFAYERREGSIRRIVLLAVMVAISVLGRCIFAAVPGFSPVTAVVVLTGIYMGPESGFLAGSLSALISNVFFGQGPWTPFQMMTWGFIGLIAGLPFLRQLLRKRGPLFFYGIFAGVFYSFLMDIWTVLSLEGGFSLTRYIMALGTAVPFTVMYAISNVVFLMLAIKPVGEKLQRIQIKHGIF